MSERRNAHDRGYTNQWKQARAVYLKQNPLCQYCAELGRTRIATIVDHIVPHKGDMGLFWDVSNWQPLCKPCHDVVKQREEVTGRKAGCDASGMPRDPNHHWRLA